MRLCQQCLVVAGAFPIDHDQSVVTQADQRISTATGNQEQARLDRLRREPVRIRDLPGPFSFVFLWSNGWRGPRQARDERQQDHHPRQAPGHRYRSAEQRSLKSRVDPGRERPGPTRQSASINVLSRKQ
jgi:hypothetical protein